MTHGRLVDYICTAPDHAPRGDGHLTIHDSRWAFCPAGGPAGSRNGEHIDGGHQWSRTEGTEIEDLRSMVRKAAARVGGSGQSAPVPTDPLAA